MRALALVALLAACGARSGLEDALGPDGDADADSDTDADSDGDGDGDGDADPIACDGRPYPRPGAAVAMNVAGRSQGIGVVIPDPLGIIIVGGVTEEGPADTMAFVDLSTGESVDLPVEGDDVVLPDRQAATVYVPAADDMIVVIGGNGPDGAMDQVFAVRGEGDLSGPRRVRATRLDDFPGGPVRGAVAAWDPYGQQIIVHGGAGEPEDPTFAKTRALRFDEEPPWIELQTAEYSPPSGAYAMGFDPVQGAVVEIAAGRDDGGARLYTLQLDEPLAPWALVAELPTAPSTRGELLYDPLVCGFHVLSARTTRCILEHWVFTSAGDAVLRDETELAPSHFLAASTYVAARDELVVYASEDCESPGVANTTAHRIPLVR